MNEYISREEAIKELRKVYEDEYPTASGDFDEYASHDVPNVLRNMPAADVQPVNQWISVDERLPKPFEKVLCYCISTLGDIDAYMIGCINKHWGLLKGETFVSEKETHRIVVYWQPLPPRPTIDYCSFCKKYGADMRGGTENDT